MALSRPFKEDSRVLPLSMPLFQAIDGVMSLALSVPAAGSISSSPTLYDLPRRKPLEIRNTATKDTCAYRSATDEL